MRKVLIFLAASAVGATVAGAAPDAARDTAQDGGASRAEIDYRKALAGKVAGEPVDCIDTRWRQSSLGAYGDKLIYKVGRDLVYVNDTTGGCQGVARGDALISLRYQTRTCRGDIAQTVDLPASIPTGSCALGSFTPYRTAK